MDDHQKAALLLKHLSPAERTNILAHLDDAQRSTLERSIEEAPDVSREELVEIVGEYQQHLKGLQAPLEETSPVVIKEASPQEESSRYLTDSKDIVRLREILANESVAVQAAVLCHIREETARTLFASLSEAEQSILLERLPYQRSLAPLIWEELAICLQESQLGKRDNQEPGRKLLSRLIGESPVPGVYEGELSESERALLMQIKES